MEKSAAEGPRKRELSPEDLAAMREVLREIASDPQAAMREFHLRNPEAAQQYREPALSVRCSRLAGEVWGASHYSD